MGARQSAGDRCSLCGCLDAMTKINPETGLGLRPGLDMNKQNHCRHGYQSGF
jgi:hypothetical protein